MLHVFFGTDTTVARQQAYDLIATGAEDNSAIQRVDTDTYTPGMFIDLAGATSLFGGNERYLIDTPSNHKDFLADVLEHLPLLAESTNLFVVIEGPLLAPEKKQFAKYAASMEEFKKPATERFNAFALADSLSLKNKRQLWVQLQEATAAGLSAEEIIGTLWWQLKSLRLAQLTNSAAEADMKDYPYNKAKRSLKHFKPGELEALSEGLLTLYHHGHGGKVDINLALEKWVLTI